MSVVTTCDHCGVIEGCRRIWDSEDHVYLDLCPDCETEYLNELDENLRLLNGDDL